MEELIMKSRKEKLIPDRYISEKGSYIENIDGQPYLIANDVMYTFYRRTKGEFSAFFLALRDEKRLLGCKCTQCGLVRVPPFLTHCPECNFAPTELVEMEQVGMMNSTPPITYFATSLFQDMAPYGRGRVIFKGSDTAMSTNLYTTTGILVPGIFKKGTEVKLVFRDERAGDMQDVFCVPTSELSKAQIRRKGLQESEIDWESGVEPKLARAKTTDLAVYKEVLKEIVAVVKEMNGNPRSRRDIAGWKRNILLKTTGGKCGIFINDGNIRVGRAPASPDFVMICGDPRTLLDGLTYRGALTDSVISKKLWISKNMEFNTIFKLDRMARSVVRSKKVQKSR
jgi:uncharacterized OB-fold protein